MKLLFALTFLVALCASQAPYPSAKQNLTDFLSGLYQGVGIAPPTEKSLQCFDETSSQYFFKWLASAYNAEVQLSVGNVTSYVTYKSSVSTYGSYVAEGFGCSAFDQQWRAFVRALGMSILFGQGIEDFEDMLALYFTAIPTDFVGFLEEPLQLIDAGNYSEAGSSLSKRIGDLRMGDYTNRIQTWFNGVFLQLGLSTPTNITNCLANAPNQANSLYNLYYLLSQFLARANQDDILFLQDLYLHSVGEEFKNLTTSQTWDCVFNNSDIYRFEKKVGFPLDPYSAEFNEVLAKFANASDYQKGLYEGAIGTLYSNFDSGAFLFNGQYFGYLYSLISKFAQTISS